MKCLWRSFSLAVSLAFVAMPPTTAQDAADSVVEIMRNYDVVPDVTYLRADGYESKLDAYVARDRSTKRPTVVHIHGGGWVAGDKDTYALWVLPYLQMGFAAVNVEYRLGGEALAPGAVEDTRCALRWVLRNAEEYGFDTERIVVTGASAGGHLSLTTGMLTADRGFDRRCPARLPATEGRGRADHEPVEMPVAAIVNWFGITDVPDLLEGENAKTYAVAWMGSLPNRMELGDELSPLTMVSNESNPPILTLHGDADLIVPYAHATQLHQKLDAAGVMNQLHTVEDGGHGDFTVEEYKEAFRVIREFLHRVFSGG